MPKRTRRPRTVPAEEEAVYFGGDEENEDSDADAEEEAEVEGHRQRFRNQRCRRRDRLVQSIKDALLPQNYRPIDPPTEESLLTVKMTKDPITNTPASEVTWTNMEPNRNSRSAAENTTYKGRRLLQNLQKHFCGHSVRSVSISGSRIFAEPNRIQVTDPQLKSVFRIRVRIRIRIPMFL